MKSKGKKLEYWRNHWLEKFSDSGNVYDLITARHYHEEIFNSWLSYFVEEKENNEKEK